MKDMAGMIAVRGGAFRMGSDDFYPDERPRREVSVGDFHIDETPVTNAQFARFVAETGYVTFAEIPPDDPDLSRDLRRPGSAVFVEPAGPVDLDDASQWWRHVFDADWRRPRGLGSRFDLIPDHPVVHVTPADAQAYADWAGKALPSEAEWEYAARGGAGTAYAWGDDFEPDGRRMAKTFQGVFPHDNAAPEGLKYTAPVRAFPPNGFGLYDMIGNVWEWTTDAYGAAAPGVPACCGPSGRRAPRQVVKGGSHLCAPSHCRRYRPAARWPQAVDTPTSHIGFRCIVRG